MPIRKPFKNLEGPFHIGARSINKEWFSIPMPEVWGIFSDQLYFLKYAFGFELHAFVLMSNHYHLMASTPFCNLSEGMAYFHRETSRALNRKGNRINRTFAGRFHATDLDGYHYFLNCYKYLYQNPVRAKIVSQCQLYPFSTLHGLLGKSKLYIPLSEDTVLFDNNIRKKLEWLNATPDPMDIESMRIALKKRTFQLPKHPTSRKCNRLENILL